MHRNRVPAVELLDQSGEAGDVGEHLGQFAARTTQERRGAVGGGQFGGEVGREVTGQRGLRPLGLPQCYVTAGCLFQTLWNLRSGRPAAENIKDYDVFYFDGADLSWEAEDAVIRRVAPLAERLGIPVEVRNQARVHLWYPARFGDDYPQLHSAKDGMSRYLVRCTCVGIGVADGEVFAPDGFADLEAGILRINPLLHLQNR